MTQFEASETIQNSSNGETLSIPILVTLLVGSGPSQAWQVRVLV
jgi:hypothetical protein